MSTRRLVRFSGIGWGLRELESWSTLIAALREVASRFDALRSLCARHRRIAITVSVIVALVSSLFLVLWVTRAGVEFGSEHAPLWLATSGLSLTAMPFFGASRWQRISQARATGTIRFGTALRTIFLSRFAGLFTMAVAADFVGRFAVAGRGADSRRQVAVTLAVDRGFDGLYAGAIAPAAILLIVGAPQPLIGSTVLLGLVLPFGALPIVRRMGHFSVVEWPIFARAWVLTVGRSLALAFGLVMAARGAGLEIGAVELFLLTPLAQVVSIFALTPGAWGVLEAGWLGLLIATGVSAEVAAAFALAQRVVLTTTFALGALGTLIVPSLWNRMAIPYQREKRNEATEP